MTISDNAKRRAALHPVDEHTKELIAPLRKRYLQLMSHLESVLPESPEASTAIRRLDESLRDAIAALVRWQPGLDVHASYLRLLDEVGDSEPDEQESS